MHDKFDASQIFSWEVAALGCVRRRLQGPEHRDGQGERDDYCEGDVEVLAHALRLTGGPQ